MSGSPYKWLFVADDSATNRSYPSAGIGPNLVTPRPPIVDELPADPENGETVRFRARHDPEVLWTLTYQDHA